MAVVLILENVRWFSSWCDVVVSLKFELHKHQEIYRSPTVSSSFNIPSFKIYLFSFINIPNEFGTFENEKPDWWNYLENEILASNRGDQMSREEWLVMITCKQIPTAI